MAARHEAIVAHNRFTEPMSFCVGTAQRQTDFFCLSCKSEKMVRFGLERSSYPTSEAAGAGSVQGIADGLV